jgi:hypothetical protein
MLIKHMESEAWAKEILTVDTNYPVKDLLFVMQYQSNNNLNRSSTRNGGI